MGRKASGQVKWRTGDRGEGWYCRATLRDGSRSKWVAMAGIERDNEAAARRIGAVVSAGLRDGTIVPATRGKTCDEWSVAYFADRDKRFTSVDNQRGRWKNYLEKHFGSKEPAEVTPEHLRALVREIDEAVQREKISWRTALAIWADVTSAFGEMCDSKHDALAVLRGKPNPCATVRGPDRGIERSKPFLRPSEVAALLSCERVAWYRRVAYAVAIFTGMRQGEMRALLPEDVDFDAMQIRISKQAVAEEVNPRTKTGRARYVTIEPNLAPLLQDLVAHPMGKRGRLLRMPHHHNCASDLVRDLKTAGLAREDLYADDEMREPMTFHKLRHTCGTHMAVRRDPPFDVQWRLGHTDAKMTERYISEARSAAGSSFGTPLAPLPEDFIRKGREKETNTVEPANTSESLHYSPPRILTRAPENKHDHLQNKPDRDKTSVGIDPFRHSSQVPVPEPSAPERRVETDPDAALRTAINVSVNAGEYERAARLLEVLRSTPPVSAVIDLATRRNERKEDK